MEENKGNIRPKIICLTPVKNEEWIIEKFLKAASIWADHIILSDHGSTDNTVKIASNFPKVTVIDNSKMVDYNAQEMRAPLFQEARRRYRGGNLLISLDADEFLTPNFDDLEWKTIMEAPIGTRFIFNWYNIQPNLNSYFIDEKIFAFIDDGAEYKVGVTHQPRMPEPQDKPYIKLNSINVLHFQFVNWERMELKHMWYRMYEKTVYPDKNTIRIWRLFHYEKNLPIDNVKVYALPKEYLSGYNKYGIELTSVLKLREKHWDDRMIKYIAENGWKKLKRLDVNRGYIRRIDQKGVLKSQKLKYNIIDLFIINYLRITQRNKNKIYIKIIDKFLMLFFK